MLAVSNRVLAVMIPVVSLVAYKLPQSPKLYIEYTVSKAIVTKSEAKQKRRHFTFKAKALPSYYSFKAFIALFTDSLGDSKCNQSNPLKVFGAPL